MRRLKYILLAFAITLSLTSCLEKLPADALLEEDAMTSLIDAELTVNGIYAGFKSSSLYSGSMVLASDIQSDLVHGVTGNSNNYGQSWTWDIRPDNSDIESVYGALYTIIGRCNYLLEKIPSIESTLLDDEDWGTYEMYIGEAHFARALAYSELARLYCEAYDPQRADEQLGMVISTTYTEIAPAVRASLKETYELILSDLEVAYDNIKDEGVNGAEYFTLSVVESLYARVYLHMQEWEKAIEYSTMVIDDGAFSLSSTNEYIDSSMSYYSYMWNYDMGMEIIWRVGYTTTSYGGALGSVFLNYDYVNYYPDYVPSAWVLNAYDYYDQRYSTFFATIATGYDHGLSWPCLIKYLGNQEFLALNILYVNEPKPFRLSEQYLIRAEAYAQMAKYSNAASDLTKLRAARYSTYGQASITADNWLEEIAEERAKELYMEGFRLTDLKRWNMGFTREAQNSTLASGNTLSIEAGDYRFVWPIPLHEIEVPTSQIEQNEGYN
ncbi:MAG: RagB/SusD family nutrient uptake outer membrane protein [Rikenellaceae bacterium]